jgi:hypothetical protein
MSRSDAQAFAPARVPSSPEWLPAAATAVVRNAAGLASGAALG